jgi:general secretion pathway protein N
MTVRRTFHLAACGLCILAGMSLPAIALTSMDDAPQNNMTGGTISLEPAQTKAAPVTGPIGNPLWAIPLSSLSITQKRPLFTPSRRPPAPAVVAPPVVQPKVVAKPAEPEHPRLTLIGTVVGETEGIGVFLDQSTQGFVRLKTGEQHSGWVLKSVKPREATLEKQDHRETLSLPKPQDSSAAPPRKEPDL